MFQARILQWVAISFSLSSLLYFPFSLSINNHWYVLYICESAFSITLFLFKDFTYKSDYTVYVFLYLNYFTHHHALHIDPVSSGGKKKIPLMRKDTGTAILIAALFTAANTRKQAKCPSTDEWIRKIQYRYSQRNTTQP